MAQPRSLIPSHQSLDVVVIGAGAAGLMTCLDLLQEFKVLLLNRNTGRRSSSRWPRGIAAVTRKEDSADSHEDTVLAGRPLRWRCGAAVGAGSTPLRGAPGQLGMAFDRDQDGLATTWKQPTATAGAACAGPHRAR